MPWHKDSSSGEHPNMMSPEVVELVLNSSRFEKSVLRGDVTVLQSVIDFAKRHTLLTTLDQTEAHEWWTFTWNANRLQRSVSAKMDRHEPAPLKVEIRGSAAWCEENRGSDRVTNPIIFYLVRRELVRSRIASTDRENEIQEELERAREGAEAYTVSDLDETPWEHTGG